METKNGINNEQELKKYYKNKKYGEIPSNRINIDNNLKQLIDNYGTCKLNCICDLNDLVRIVTSNKNIKELNSQNNNANNNENDNEFKTYSFFENKLPIVTEYQHLHTKFIQKYGTDTTTKHGILTLQGFIPNSTIFINNINDYNSEEEKNLSVNSKVKIDKV